VNYYYCTNEGFILKAVEDIKKGDPLVVGVGDTTSDELFLSHGICFGNNM